VVDDVVDGGMFAMQMHWGEGERAEDGERVEDGPRSRCIEIAVLHYLLTSES